MRVASWLVVLVNLSGGCAGSDTNAELSTLAAIEHVRLVEVESVTGESIQYVGSVQRGQIVAVVEGHPRKSDIDVIIAYRGRRLVARDGKYALVRRAFDRRRDLSALKTSSCWGLLGG
jgi:hypothetical protein